MNSLELLVENRREEDKKTHYRVEKLGDKSSIFIVLTTTTLD